MSIFVSPLSLLPDLIVRRKPNRVILIVVTLVVAFLGAALLTSRISDLRSTVEAYDIQGDDLVVISLRVDRDPTRAPPLH